MSSCKMNLKNNTIYLCFRVFTKGRSLYPQKESIKKDPTTRHGYDYAYRSKLTLLCEKAGDNELSGSLSHI